MLNTSTMHYTIFWWIKEVPGQCSWIPGRRNSLFDMIMKNYLGFLKCNVVECDGYTIKSKSFGIGSIFLPNSFKPKRRVEMARWNLTRQWQVLVELLWHLKQGTYALSDKQAIIHTLQQQHNNNNRHAKVFRFSKTKSYIIIINPFFSNISFSPQLLFLSASSFSSTHFIKQKQICSFF